MDVVCGCVVGDRDQLQQRFRKREAYLEVDLRVLSAYDLALHDLVLKQPNEYLPAVSSVTIAHFHAFVSHLSPAVRVYSLKML